MADFTRRQLLAAALPLFAALGCHRRQLRKLPPEHARDSASIIGRAWLDTQPAEPDPAALVEELTRGAPSDPAALAAHLEEMHLEDLELGRTRSVNGWLLSATETKLYAIVALS